MKRLPLFIALLFSGLLLAGAGCSSDPNVEGAKLDLRNKDYDRALENLDKALETNPENAEAILLKGQVLQEKASNVREIEEHSSLVEEMLAAYQRAVEVDPKLEGDLTPHLRMAYYNEFQRGVQAFNRAQKDREVYNEAVRYFDLAAKIQPDSAGAYTNKAFALLNAGKQEDAIEPLEKAIEKGDTQAQSYVLLSDLYIRNERSQDAVTLLESAREVHPEDQDIQSQLLNAYIQSGQVGRAVATYKEAVEREPENELFRYNYGSLLLQTENYDEAIVQLSKAVELKPDYGNALYNLGAAYVNKAVDLSEEITELDDALRSERSNLSDAEIKQREDKIDEMVAQRRSIFEKAVAPLEKAKQILEAEGTDAGEVCRALFSAYVQTDQQSQAESIAACAGYEDLK